MSIFPVPDIGVAVGSVVTVLPVVELLVFVDLPNVQAPTATIRIRSGTIRFIFIKLAAA